MGFPSDSAGKQSTRIVRDLGLIPGLGRAPGEEKANFMDCIVHGAAKSQTLQASVSLSLSTLL